MIKSTIDPAQSTGVPVVAEGAETAQLVVVVCSPEEGFFFGFALHANVPSPTSAHSCVLGQGACSLQRREHSSLTQIGQVGSSAEPQLPPIG